MQKMILVLGDQLFPVERYLKEFDGRIVFMAEDLGLCTRFKYHWFKLVLFLSSMRKFSEELRSCGFWVKYVRLDEDTEKKGFMGNLEEFVRKNKIRVIEMFEISDKFFRIELLKFAEKLGLEVKFIRSPSFLTSREEFVHYLNGGWSKDGRKVKPFMKNFYENQRKRLKILIDENGKPIGGKWSFDKENRKKLPDGYVPMARVKIEIDEVVREVFLLVEKMFSEHPKGKIEDFWLATDRKSVMKVFAKVLEELRDFGDYEDAISSKFDFVNHTTLSPYLNLGLILPEEIVFAILKKFENGEVPINSAEGLIRQIIGWREFIKGIYDNFGEKEEVLNFFGHKRKLPEYFYKGKSGILPLDHCLEKVRKLGYLHHIERLMIVGNLMLLMEVDPKEVYRWFMEMFVDSADWVMVPNVFGMSQFSDGGIFATKPYVCGSNYVLKMSDFKKGEWCKKWDELFWGFVGKNIEYFAKNPRLSMMAKNWKKRIKK